MSTLVTLHSQATAAPGLLPQDSNAKTLTVCKPWASGDMGHSFVKAWGGQYGPQEKLLRVMVPAQRHGRDP